MRVIRVGTRASKLAIKQAEIVIEKLRARWANLKCELITIKTLGDINRTSPLEKLGGEGVFVKELESALLEGKIDIAVHSLKDMPTNIPNGLVIAAVPLRDDAREALISRYSNFDILPAGATIGTSSLRRRAQLLRLRSDLKVVSYRGNLDTRIRKVKSGEGPDAAVVALAGLLRLGLNGIASYVFDERQFLPAAAQGAIAVEAASLNIEILKIVGAIDDIGARKETEAERAVLNALGVGCRLPVGVRCFFSNDKLSIVARVLDPDGVRVVEAEIKDFGGMPIELGRILAQRLIDEGALDIIRSTTQGKTKCGSYKER